MLVQGRGGWLVAFFAALREQIPAELRRGAAGTEFMNYEVLADPERSNHPDQIVIHTMEAGLPIGKAVTYNGTLFTATTSSDPTETAAHVVAWLRIQPENRAS